MRAREITTLAFAALRERLTQSSVDALASRVADGTWTPSPPRTNCIAEHVR